MSVDSPQALPSTSASLQLHPPLFALSDQLDGLLEAVRRTVADELASARTELARVTADIERARSEAARVRAIADAEARRIRTTAAQVAAAQIAGAKTAREGAERARHEAEAATATARAEMELERARLRVLLEGDLTTAREDLDRMIAGLLKAMSALGPPELEAASAAQLPPARPEPPEPPAPPAPEATVTLDLTGDAAPRPVVLDPVTAAVRSAISRAITAAAHGDAPDRGRGVRVAGGAGGRART
jgi:hypothetical protein